MMIRLCITSLFLIFCWWFFVFAFDLPTYILPSPDLVFMRLMNAMPLLLDHCIITFSEIIIGFMTGTFLGVLTACLMLYFPFFRLMIYPLLLITQTIPVFVIAPLIVLWCGYGMFSKIIMITLLLYFKIASTFYDGLCRTPFQFLEMAQLMRANRFKTLLYIQFPSALPQLFSGLKLGAVFAPIAALVGEWVGASRGLGFLILDAYTRMDMPLLFAALFVHILMSVCFYHFVTLSTQKFTPWIQEKS